MGMSAIFRVEIIDEDVLVKSQPTSLPRVLTISANSPLVMDPSGLMVANSKS